MRGTRAKQYRKLMHQYSLTFNFREPYQVLLDAAMVQDSARFKMDLVAALKRTLQGDVKPMITQCSMRHLYTASPKDDAVIDLAKTFERRRCNHHELEHPLSTMDCFKSVVDPKGSRTNKHRYVVACQDADVRAFLRRIPGVPMIYIARSVMIMESMAGATQGVRRREEKDKLRAGLKGARGAQVLGKRTRDEGDEGGDDEGEGLASDGKAAGNEIATEKARKKKRGPKGPNPLSVKKAKKPKADRPPREGEAITIGVPLKHLDGDESSKRKRKRRRKPKAESGQADLASAEAEAE